MNESPAFTLVLALSKLSVSLAARCSRSSSAGLPLLFGAGQVSVTLSLSAVQLNESDETEPHNKRVIKPTSGDKRG